MTEEIKKSYNPFKMWGSLVGLILFPLILTSLSAQDPFSGIFTVEGQLEITIIAYLVYAIVGFLIGWGIHSLIRKYKN